MNENDVVYEGDIYDQLGAIYKKMSELDETSKEFKDLAELSVQMHKVYNEQVRIENEAKAKEREQELEKERLKKERKQKKRERELKEKELKSQRQSAWITGGLALIGCAFTAGASLYSTRQNRKNLEDTLHFEKTGIVRSAGHKHVSKKG
jgi:hypothetical protein